MNGPGTICRAALTALLLVATTATAPAQLLPDQFIQVVAVAETEPVIVGQPTRVAVQIQVLDGYHVNANPASEEWLIPTEIELESPAGGHIEHVYYPPAREDTFAFYSGTLRVYEGTVVAGAVFSLPEDTPAGPGDLVLVVRYQACNDQACFAPKRIRARVPVTVAAPGTAVRRSTSPLFDQAPFPQRSEGSL